MESRYVQTYSRELNDRIIPRSARVPQFNPVATTQAQPVYGATYHVYQVHYELARNYF